jgi:hypothetical protein
METQWMMDPDFIDYAAMADDDDYDPRKPEYIQSASKEQMEHFTSEILGRQIAQLETFVERRLGASRSPSKELQHYNQVCAELRQARPRRLSTPTVQVCAELREARPRRWSTPTVIDIDSASLLQYARSVIHEDTEVEPDTPKQVQRIRKSVLQPIHAVPKSRCFAEDYEDCCTRHLTMKSFDRGDTTSTEYDPSPKKHSSLDDSLSTDYNPTVASSISSDDAHSTADDNSECRSCEEFFFDRQEAWTPPGTPVPYTPPMGPVTPTGTFAKATLFEDYETFGRSMELDLEQSMQLDMEPSMQPFTPMTRCVEDFEASDQIMGQSAEMEPISPKWGSNKEISSAVLAYLEGKSQYEQSKEQIAESDIEPVSPQWESSNESRIARPARVYLSGKYQHDQSKETANDVRARSSGKGQLASPKPVPSSLAFKSERVGKSSGSSDADLAQEASWFGGILAERISLLGDHSWFGSDLSARKNIRVA